MNKIAKMTLYLSGKEKRPGELSELVRQICGSDDPDYLCICFTLLNQDVSGFRYGTYYVK